MRACSRRGSRAPRGCARSFPGLFGARVEIDEFVGAWLTLDASERSRLGARQSGLGSDCVLGASMFSVSDKFRVRVFVRDFAQYERFLPGSDFARQIGDAVFLYVGEEYDWDMELAIPAGEITPVRLGQGAKLGWTSWMAPNWSKTDETIRKDATISCRQPSGAASARRPTRIREGGNHGRGHQRRIGGRQAQPRRLRGLHPGAAAGQERRQPQHRARPLDAAPPAEGRAPISP